VARAGRRASRRRGVRRRRVAARAGWQGALRGARGGVWQPVDGVAGERAGRRRRRRRSSSSSSSSSRGGLWRARLRSALGAPACAAAVGALARLALALPAAPTPLECAGGSFVDNAHIPHRHPAGEVRGGGGEGRRGMQCAASVAASVSYGSAQQGEPPGIPCCCAPHAPPLVSRCVLNIPSSRVRVWHQGAQVGGRRSQGGRS